MRRSAVAAVPLVLAAAFALAGPAAAANPPGTGQPGQSCQDLEPNTPGHASSSPGSPFNEPGVNSVTGGTGGAHYAASSQYDVACFQQSQRP